MIGLLILSGFLNSCASKTELPDVMVCAPEDFDEGICVYTLSDVVRHVNNGDMTYNGLTWHELLRRSLVIPVDSWSRIKIYILEQCAKDKKCSENHSSSF